MEYYSNSSHVEVLQAILDLDDDKRKLLKELDEIEESVIRTRNRRKIESAFIRSFTLRTEYNRINDKLSCAHFRRSELLGEVRAD